MTSRVTASKAKTELLNLLTRVEAGEDFEISRHGKVIACLLAPGDFDYLPKPERPLEAHQDLASGVLRPAPGAADQFVGTVQAQPIAPQAAQEPRGLLGAGDHKKTAPEPILPRSPVSAPKPLTLADIIRAGGS